MTSKIVAIADRLEVVQQSLLHAFEGNLFLLKGIYKLFEMLCVLLLMVLGGKAPPHIEPLKATD
jgi:hypothetical protein